MTDRELDQGYKLCECGHGVLLLQAGYEVELHKCNQCMSEVADADVFFKTNEGVRALSK